MFVSEKFQSLSDLLIRVRNDLNEFFQPLLGGQRESIKEAVGVETGGPERQAASSKLSLDRIEFFLFIFLVARNEDRQFRVLVFKPTPVVEIPALYSELSFEQTQK